MHSNSLSCYSKEFMQTLEDRLYLSVHSRYISQVARGVSNVFNSSCPFHKKTLCKRYYQTISKIQWSQFIAEQFQIHLKKNTIGFITSGSHPPTINQLVEKFTQSFKNVSNAWGKKSP